MGTLGTGKGHRLDDQAGRGRRLDLYLDVLMAQQLDARASVVPTNPVTPKDGLWTNDQWMQQHAHLARFRGGAAIPLTLLAKRTGTTTADAGRIHHALVDQKRSGETPGWLTNLISEKGIRAID